jgi:hypothetical protein
MGGQDGYSRDLLTYNEEANTLLGGIKIHPTTRWDLGLSLSYTSAEAGLDPFGLPADDYVATHPQMAFDFSKTYTYSDLDVSRLDGDLMIKYKLSDAMWLRFSWSYVDYTDDAPYLYDTGGSVQWATLAAGWYF